MKGQGPISWKTVVIYVDIDTGEVLHKDFAQKHYTTLKKTKEYQTNKNRTRGTTTITKYSRKKDMIQSELF